ncbi:DegT/DnrJ/EryC1/StrS family aminotransferase [Kineococcus glutinatus]|uniref:dTDP-4-amino-4,6-dideoxy-D-glucose aminotransferase VioA n=1 Tax=Kineococcus glutinatus TaxID=1070872 RepID=A0ABP9HAC3_9ACTN
MIPITRPTLPPLEEYAALLERIWDSRMLSNFGPFARQLEDQTRDYLGVGHAAVVVSGDIGLMIALSSLQLPTGSPCFLPSFTFNSTVNAVLWNGLTPVFVDVDADTFTMSAEDLALACDREPRPGVVLATHVFGNPCDHDGLRAVADRHGHRLAYDAAHGYGSLRDGVHVGALGDVEVFSLSGTKLVTSAEGGLVTTSDPVVAERIGYLRAYGFQGDYSSRYVGINGKMSELHAALGLLALAEVEVAVADRLALLRAYRERLGAAVGFQRVRSRDRSTHKDIALRLGSDRAAVEAALTAVGVQTKRYFRPLHDMPAYRRWSTRPLPATDEVYEHVLCVPAFSGLDEAGLSLICDTVLRTLQRAGAARVCPGAA